jgi:hypothetical protein
MEQLKNDDFKRDRIDENHEIKLSSFWIIYCFSIAEKF